MALADVLRETVEEIVLKVLRREGVYNSQTYLDGKVAAVVADGKHADVFINASATATLNIPIAPHVGTLTVNDEVVVLNRAKMRDLIILYKKVL